MVLACSGMEKQENSSEEFDVEEALEHCKVKLYYSIKNFQDEKRLPRHIKKGEQHWSGSSINSWTVGFYPGILWKMYDYSKEQEFLLNAQFYTQMLEPIKSLPWKTHDLGFMMYYSYGLGYEITKNQHYKAVLLEVADSLATLYKPEVGIMESWPWMKRKKGWPHTTIIDNMMNLELLFWAAENGGKQILKEIAIAHALRTRKDFIREDNSTVHVVVYDSISSKVIKKVTDQGYSDYSTWSRGQAWGIYGFAKAYQYSGKQEFLETSQKLADYYLDNLPADLIPYWDFNAPNIPNEEKDASAASITASALFDLSQMVSDSEQSERYFKAGKEILKNLSSANYLSENSDAFLEKSVGSHAGKQEVGIPIIYADYYYLEALLKLKEIQNNEQLVNTN